MTPPVPVYVVWEDIKTLHASETWTETKDMGYEPFLVHQVGFLLEDAPTHIRITQAWNPELMSPPDQIPRGAIRNIWFLSPADPVKTGKKRRTI